MRINAHSRLPSLSQSNDGCPQCNMIRGVNIVKPTFESTRCQFATQHLNVCKNSGPPWPVYKVRTGSRPALNYGPALQQLSHNPHIPQPGLPLSNGMINPIQQSSRTHHLFISITLNPSTLTAAMAGMKRLIFASASLSET